MNNNIFKKFMGLFLAFVMMISIIPTNVCAKGNIINVDGYDVQILEDSTEREVVKLVMEDGIYIMTHNLFKDDYILEKQSRGKNFARSLFKTSTILKCTR